MATRSFPNRGDTPWNQIIEPLLQSDEDRIVSLQSRLTAYEAAWKDYTPTVRDAHGNILGPGSGGAALNAGRYKVIGKTCFFKQIFRAGNTGVNGGDGIWIFDLPPFPMPNGQNYETFAASIFSPAIFSGYVPAFSRSYTLTSFILLAPVSPGDGVDSNGSARSGQYSVVQNCAQVSGGVGAQSNTGVPKPNNSSFWWGNGGGEVYVTGTYETA